MPKKDTQFKKGHPGGPGRPKKERCFGDTVREIMQAQDISVEWTVNGSTKRLKVESTKNMYYGVAAALVMEALKGNVPAAKEIIDRSDGKVTNVIESNGEMIVRFDADDEGM